MADPLPRHPPQQTREGQGVLDLLPVDAVSEHVLKADGQTIPYTATAGTLDLFGQTGDRTAAIFYTAYVAKKSDGEGPRPITFVFNGGPGAASAYLNLGLVGPRILDFGPEGHDGASARLVDNPHSWLQFTDLVLIDPIGTGWSRTAKPDDASNFYGVRPDADSLAKAIALYVSRNGRASSPKYLLGESYGGFRAAKVASSLREDQGILVSGIIMLSPLIEGHLVFGTNEEPFGAALQLPSLAAAELERRGAFSESALRDAEQFALHDYLPTIAGPRLSGNEAEAFYGRVSQLTGIPLDVVTRKQGLVGDAYVKHSARDPADVVSPYDAGLNVPDPYPESEVDHSDDPVLDGFTRAYGGMFASYARDELGFKTDMTYILLSTDVNGHWQWGSGRREGSRSEASASDDIRQLLSVIPSFRLLVAQGYSDLVIPYGVNKYVLEHLPQAVSDRAALKLYRGGHMFYTRPASREAFSADARAFFAAGTPAPRSD
jgi:carboxypeptidase C (cathepsin A)